MPSLHLRVTPLDMANIRLLDPPFQEVVSATTLVLPVALRGRAASRHSTASARRRAAHPPAPARRRSASFHQRPAFPSSERHNDDGIMNKPPNSCTLADYALRSCSEMLRYAGSLRPHPLAQTLGQPREGCYCPLIWDNGQTLVNPDNFIFSIN